MFLFRRLLQPDVIELGIDPMFMDNDDAKCRHGMKSSYNKKKGFQPLQMDWGWFIIDAVFRSGDKHLNNGEAVTNMIRHMVLKIRFEYRGDAPIIIFMDRGFFDQRKSLRFVEHFMSAMSVVVKCIKTSNGW